MVSELTSSLPHSGGYFVWVERAFGSFWGSQAVVWSFFQQGIEGAVRPLLLFDAVCPFFAPAPALAHDSAAYFVKAFLVLAMTGVCVALGASDGVANLFRWFALVQAIPIGLFVLVGTSYLRAPPSGRNRKAIARSCRSVVRLRGHLQQTARTEKGFPQKDRFPLLGPFEL